MIFNKIKLGLFNVMCVCTVCFKNKIKKLNLSEMFEFPCFYGFKLVHTRVGQAVHFQLAQLCHQKSGSGKNWDFGKIGLREK